MPQHNKDKWSWLVPTADTKLRYALVVAAVTIIASIFLKPWLLSYTDQLRQFTTTTLFIPFYYVAEWTPITAEQRRSKKYSFLSFIPLYIILVSVFLAPVM